MWVCGWGWCHSVLKSGWLNVVRCVVSLLNHACTRTHSPVLIFHFISLYTNSVLGLPHLFQFLVPMRNKVCRVLEVLLNLQLREEGRGWGFIQPANSTSSFILSC